MTTTGGCWPPSRTPTTTRSTSRRICASPAGCGTVTVTGAECQVFVRVPGGDILVNRSLARGESVRFEEPQLSVVLGDGSAAQVFVNGKLRPPGKAGQRVAFVAARS